MLGTTPGTTRRGSELSSYCVWLQGGRVYKDKSGNYSFSFWKAVRLAYLPSPAVGGSIQKLPLVAAGRLYF